MPGIDINIPRTKEILKHASKKQTAMLFRAILDYAETGELPKVSDGELHSVWLASVFPHIISQGGGDHAKE